MFDHDISINGPQVSQLKDLCELAGNVPDAAEHNNYKIFKAYVDAYVLCPLIGYHYSRRLKQGSSKDGHIGIRANELISRQNELKFIYQILMLIDEESEPDKDKRVYRAFNFNEKTDEERNFIRDNMTIYNEYFLGGVEVLHQEIVEKCTDDDSYEKRIYEYVKQFSEEQNPDALQASINSFLNR